VVVDAADLRTAPPTLRRRLAAAELDIELALHRGARRWPPLARLEWPSGDGRAELGEDELGSLLEAADALAGLGVEVHCHAALTGTLEVGDAIVTARAEGELARLGRRLAEVASPHEAAEPEGLHATLRGYQRRGLAWLLAMCELGMGGCLADDMGLGKTIQV